MATPKTWTAHDIKQGRFAVLQEDATLQIERRYKFVDDAGVVLEDIAGGRLTAEVEWSTIPPNIQAALQEIDIWTYNLSLTQEGMA
jgi:hypothetical protein